MTVDVADPHTGALTVTPSIVKVGSSGEVTELKFENEYHAAPVEKELKATKKLTGRTLAADEFNFSLTLVSALDAKNNDIKSAASVTSDTRTNGTAGNNNVDFGTLRFTKAGTYVYELKETSLSNNGVKTDSSVYTLTYTVKDKDSKGVLTCEDPVIVKKTSEGSTEAASVEFLNTYSADDTTADLAASKKLMRGDTALSLKAGQFEFSLTKDEAYTLAGGVKTSITDKNADQTKLTNEADGSIRFDTLTYDAAGTYVYKLKETMVSTDDIKNDPTVYYAVVEVTDDGAGAKHSAVTYYKGSVAEENKQTAAPVFTNTAVVGSLSIKKKVSGNASSDKLTKSFDFTVTLSNHGENVTEDYAATLVSGSSTKEIVVSFKNGTATVKLKHGEELTIRNLPAGASYTVKEATGEAYRTELTVSGGASKADLVASGTIPEGVESIPTASYENIYDTFGDLSIRKELTGNDLDAKQGFTAKVTILNGSDADTSFAGTYGDATFSAGVAYVAIKAGETKKITNLPNGTKYQVEEQMDAGVDFGLKEIKNATGTIKGGNTGDKAVIVTIVNERNTYGGLEVKKLVNGNATVQLSKFHFKATFTAKDEDGNPLKGSYAELTFKDGKAETEFDLENNKMDGSVKRFMGLPNGTVYRIEETDYSASGYVTTPASRVIEGTIQGSASYTTAEAAAAGEATNTAVFTNTRNTNGALTITKEVQGNQKAEVGDETFTIKVTLEGLSESNVSGLKVIAGEFQKEFGITGSTATAELLIKDSETISITGIPTGTKYKVEEIDASKRDLATFTTTYSITSGGETRAVNNGTIADIGGNEVKIVNRKDLYGGLVISKKRAGNDADKKSWFEFKVTLSDKTINGTYGDVVFVNGVSSHAVDQTHADIAKVHDGYFMVMEDQPAVITGLPAGISYTVEEYDYSSTYDKQEPDTNATGKIEAVSGEVTAATISDNNKTTFTNTRDRWGKLQIKKLIQGDTTDIPASTTYRFDVHVHKGSEELSGTYTGIAFSGGHATVELHAGEAFTFTDLPLGYAFEVKEVADDSLAAAGLDGTYYVLTYNEQQYDEYGNKKKYTDDSGSLKDYKELQTKENTRSDTVSIDMRTVTVTNTFHKTTAALQVTKHINAGDKTVKPETFQFTLTAVSNTAGVTTPMPEGSDGATKTVSVTASSDSDGIATFGDIVFKKAGTYNYTIAEVAPAEADKLPGMTYDTTPVTVKVEVTENASTHSLSATVSYKNSGADEFSSSGVVTNKFVEETTNSSVEKIWNDKNNSDGSRPASISVTLTGKAGTEVVSTKTVTLNAANEWKATVSELPKYQDRTEIKYTWSEDAVPTGYTLTSTDTSVSGTTKFTNSHTPITSVIATKVWAGDTAGDRPASIELHLQADGTNVPDSSKTISPDSEGNWPSVTWTNLNKLNSADNPITYTVVETKVPGYESAVAGSIADGFTVTNTKQADTEYVHNKVTIKKVDGSGNALSGATFQLRDGSTVVKTFTGGSFDIKTDDAALAGLLPAAGASKTLTLVETAAPSGYEKDGTAHTVVIATTQSAEALDTAKDKFITTITYTITIDGKTSLNVTNKKTPSGGGDTPPETPETPPDKPKTPDKPDTPPETPETPEEIPEIPDLETPEGGHEEHYFDENGDEWVIIYGPDGTVLGRRRVLGAGRARTGDESNMALWIALMALSAAGIATAGYTRKRRKDKKQ